MKKVINHARRYAKDFNILTRLYQLYAIYILFVPFSTLFYKLNVKRNKKLDKNKLYIYAGNHISYLDPFMMGLVSKRKMAFMAKKELFEGSDYVRKNITRLGAFSVNREKLEVSTIKTCIDVFKAKFTLGIFPQGGIRKEKTIEKVNKGFVAVAKLVKADIVPVGISGLESYNWNIFKRQPVNVLMGEPISYELSEDEIIDSWRKQVADLTKYKLVD